MSAAAPSVKHIVIIGGGPAGLTAAIAIKSSLAAAQFDVMILDHKLPFEKPCGGGITAKTLHAFPFLTGLQHLAVTTNQFSFESGHGLRCEVESLEALTIVSRKDLGAFLLEKALALGVRHYKEKAMRLGHDGKKAFVQTDHGAHAADVLIGADGAQGASRRLFGVRSFEKNRAAGLGFYVEGIAGSKAVIKFLPRKHGYLWVFPRPTHASVGFFAVAGEVSRGECERIIKTYLDEHYPGVKLDPAKTYSATIPLIFEWHKEQFTGTVHQTPFALAGDAAGFADPITGEGIYYAFKSGAMLAEAICTGDILKYKQRCEAEIIPELQKSARLFPKFYRTHFIDLMVLLSRRSRSVQRVMSDLITGTQSYLTLKSRLKSLAPKILREMLFGG